MLAHESNPAAFPLASIRPRVGGAPIASYQRSNLTDTASTRFANAECLQAAAGIAPITTQSGKSRVVSARWSASKFIRQTFHEYAGLSIGKCEWANAYYQNQIAKGKSAQSAKRALAYKWIRIIFRLWQSTTGYSDSRYTERLAITGSPFAKSIGVTG